MARRSSPARLFQTFFKKGSLAGFIFLLLLTLANLILHYAPSEPIQLPSSEAPVELYSNQTGDNLTHLFEEAIGSAKKSVTLLIYALTDPEIIHALQKASNASISLYIVCDAKASPGISHHLPNATIVKRFGKGLMHQKILIVDNQKIWLGSANFTYNSLNVHGNLVMGLDNPSLAEALTKRAKSMDEEGKYTPLLHKQTEAGQQNIELWTLPDDPDAVKRMIQLFRSAKKTIKAALFTWTRTDFAHELIAASKRGVDIEVVIDRYSGRGASAKIVELLEKEKIPVRLSTGNKLMHHKFAYIDDVILVNGSANWTKAAFQENDDYFMIISPLTSSQQTKMNDLWRVLLKESDTPKAISAAMALRAKRGEKEWKPSFERKTK